MSRSDYTRQVRNRELAQFDRQMKGFRAFIRAFRAAPDTPVEIASMTSAKDRHSTRVDQKRHRKLGHQAETPER
jgi:hypothetical protein